MLSVIERRDLLWDLVDQLQALTGHVVNGGHWTSNRRAAGAHVGDYVERLLAHSIRADGRSAQAELRLLQSYHRDLSTWTEEEREVLDTAEAEPDFIFSVPAFFDAACVHDQIEGTSVALKMLDVILRICDVIIDVDAGNDMRERLLRAEVQSVLWRAIEASRLRH